MTVKELTDFLATANETAVVEICEDHHFWYPLHMDDVRCVEAVKYGVSA